MPNHTPRGSWRSSTWAPARFASRSPKWDRTAHGFSRKLAKGVLLGRDTFSLGAIRSQTIDAAIAALSGFTQIMERYGVGDVHAVATSAVREARNGDMFLDRIQARTGVVFDIINEAEESRLVFLAVRDALNTTPRRSGADAAGGGRRRQHEPDAAPARRTHSLGRVRAGRRPASSAARPAAPQPEIQVALLKRYVANVIDEIRLEIPLNRITHFVAIGGDVRFAAAQIREAERSNRIARSIASSFWRSATRSSVWTRRG